MIALGLTAMIAGEGGFPPTRRLSSAGKPGFVTPCCAEFEAQKYYDLTSAFLT